MGLRVHPGCSNPPQPFRFARQSLLCMQFPRVPQSTSTLEWVAEERIGEPPPPPLFRGKVCANRSLDPSRWPSLLYWQSWGFLKTCDRIYRSHDWMNEWLLFSEEQSSVSVLSTRDAFSIHKVDLESQTSILTFASQSKAPCSWLLKKRVFIFTAWRRSCLTFGVQKFNWNLKVMETCQESCS